MKKIVTFSCGGKLDAQAMKYGSFDRMPGLFLDMLATSYHREITARIVTETTSDRDENDEKNI